MADTKTTYPDSNAGQSGAKRDGSTPNQGGVNNPANPNANTSDCK